MVSFGLILRVIPPSTTVFNSARGTNILILVEPENFELFDDWEERYRYLIDLGRALPKMNDDVKIEDNIVRGCTSQVWMTSRVENDRFYFEADSDAHIVRGLIALLMAAYQGKTLADIRQIDIEQIFQEIGLDQHLSPNRRNGFFAMVERIKSASASATVA